MQKVSSLLRLDHLLIFLILTSLVFLPKHSVPLFGFPLKTDDLFFIGIIAPIMMLRIIELIKGAKPAIWVITFWIACLGLGSLIHPSNGLVFIKSLTYLCLPLLLMQTHATVSNDALVQIIKIAISFICLLVLCQKLFYFPYFHSSQFDFAQLPRPSGLYGNAIEASMLLIFLFMLLTLISKKFDYLFFILAFVGIAITESRISLVSMGIFAFAVFLTTRLPDLKYRKYIISLGMLGFSALVLLIWFDLDESQRVYLRQGFTSAFLVTNWDGEHCYSFYEIAGIDTSLNLRFSKWLFVVNAVVTGGFPEGFGFGACIGGAADNQYIRFLSDYGLVLGTFLSVILTIVLMLFILRLNSIFFAGAIVILCHLVFFDLLYMSRIAPLFYVMIALGIQDLFWGNYD